MKFNLAIFHTGDLERVARFERLYRACSWFHPCTKLRLRGLLNQARAMAEESR